VISPFKRSGGCAFFVHTIANPGLKSGATHISPLRGFGYGGYSWGIPTYVGMTCNEVRSGYLQADSCFRRNRTESRSGAQPFRVRSTWKRLHV
jgi:hypothetical protein